MLSKLLPTDNFNVTLPKNKLPLIAHYIPMGEGRLLFVSGTCPMNNMIRSALVTDILM